MKSKKLFLLALASSTCFASCDLLNDKEEMVEESLDTFENVDEPSSADEETKETSGKEETKPSSPETPKEEEKDPEEPQEPQEPQEPKEPKEPETDPSQEPSQEVVESVDYSKENYTLTWDTGDEKVVQNNIPRGEYPEFGEIPVKANNKAGYMNHFIGWSKDGKATAGLNESELSPVIRDTTYHALYEEVESCKVTIKPGIQSNGKLTIGKAGDDIPVWKEFEVPKGSKITSELLDWNSIYIPTPNDSDKYYTISSLANYDLFYEDNSIPIEAYAYNTLEKIPAVTKDIELTITYNSNSKTYYAYFYNLGQLYISGIFDGALPCYKGDTIATHKFAGQNSYDDKFSVFAVPDPVKLVDGKKYTFKGWNKNANATTGYALSQLTDTITGDVSYHAIYDNNNPTTVSLSYSTKNSGSGYTTKFYNFTEAQSSSVNAFTVTTNKKLTFNRSNFVASKTENMEICIPNDSGVETFDSTTFASYTKLTSIKLPNTLTSLPENAFKGCSGLRSVDISSCTNLRNIPASAFEGCSNLVEIKGFSNIQTIGNYAFSGCKSLKLPSLTNVTSIGEEAFKGTSGDTNGKVTIPTSVKTISKGAFTDGSFKEVEIKNGSITIINPLTFANNSKLTTVTIPAGVSNILYESGNSVDSNNPFQGSDNITSLNINSSNSNYYSYKNSIIKKSNNALIYGNASTIISDSVKIINGYSFYKSEITRIRIPSSITNLNHQAFVGAKLNRIDYDGTKEQFKTIIRSMPFYGLSQEVKVHCSDGILTSNGTSLS